MNSEPIKLADLPLPARMRRIAESSNPNDFDAVAFNRVKSWEKRVINLAAAQLTPAEFVFKGNFLFVDTDSTGEAAIALNSDSAPAFPFKASTGIFGPEYEKLYITWAAQPGSVLNLWYGFDARIIPPNQDVTSIGAITSPVEVFPSLTTNAVARGPDAITVAGAAFIGGARQAASPGNVSIVQLMNPAGSGKVLFVDSLTFLPGANMGVLLYRHTAALGSDSGQAGNKDIGGGAPSGQVRVHTAAAGVGTVLTHWGTIAASQEPIKFDPPLLLQAGEGVHLHGATVNNDVYGNFQWREYAV